MLGVSKAFPGVRALEGSIFGVEPGEIHALMGENGAGKSTLIKIMTGALRGDGGEIRLDGHPVQIEFDRRGASPRHRHGLSGSQSRSDDVGDQEPDARPPAAQVRADRLARRADVARERLKRLNIDIDVERPLGAYPVAIQQLVAIARALDDDTRVLVLDEPTASLDANETELLFGIMRDLKKRGISMVFITHFIDQVYRIADRISVLRNGTLVGTAATADLPPLKLVSMMLGRELEQTEERLDRARPL